MLLNINAYIEYYVCIVNIQYTIRNIPPAVDQVIRKRSKQTVVDLLSLQTFGTTNPKLDYSFDWLYGKDTLDASFDQAVAEQSKVDKKLWR